MTSLHALHQVPDAETVHRVAEADLGFHLVPLGDRHLAHVVPEPGHLQALRVLPGAGGPHPDGELLLHLAVLPVPHDHRALQAHARADEAELPVAVRRLVEVHEVHVDLAQGMSLLYWVCRCTKGFFSAESPAIHIFAGEKVCIQVISPMQFFAALASRHRSRIPPGWSRRA